MSSIDERVVELQFNNGQFESGVQQSVQSLQKLKNSLNFKGYEQGLSDLQKAGQNFNLSNVTDNIQKVADRFSFLGNFIDQLRTRVNNSIINFGRGIFTSIPRQIIEGGKRRAQNIEQAQFQLKGLLKNDFDWDKISKDLDYAVSGTAYGLDAAAKAAAQLKASNIDFGDEMKTALRGISGVAAMTNSSYEDISHIFTKIAGQGRVMTEELNQFAGRGLNVAATLAEHYKVSEAKLREMVTKGKVDFKTFAKVMNDTFGEQATKANDTFSGALSNVKASFSRMGAKFATPVYENLRKTFVALIPVLKDFEKIINPLASDFTKLAESVSETAVAILEHLHGSLISTFKLGGDFSAPVERVTKLMESLGKASEDALDFNSKTSPKSIMEVGKEAANTTKVYAEAAKSLEELDRLEKKYKAEGKDTKLVEQEKKKAQEAINNVLLETSKSYGDLAESDEKVSKGEKRRQELLKKSTEFAEGFRKKVSAFLGLEKEETEVIKENSSEYSSLEEVAQAVILGKFDNGEERKKKLEELGVSYAVIQNKVNELLGVSKRYEVTAEEQARTMAFFGQKTKEAGKETEKTESNFEKIINILAGIGAALSIIKNFGEALINHIIRPFLTWAIPKVLGLILTGLTALSNVLQNVNKKLIDTDFFNTKFAAIAKWFVSLKDKVADFWDRFKELDGVKNVVEAFNNLVSVLSNLWNTIVTKVKTAFDSFFGSMEMSEADTQGLLNIINDLANGLATFINFIADHVDDVAAFFKPLFDFILDLGPSAKRFWDVMGGFEGLRSAFQPLVTWFISVGTAFKTFWDTITNNMGIQGIFDTIKSEGATGILNAFSGLFTSIGDAFSTLGKGVQGKFDSFVKKLGMSEKGRKIIEAFTNTFGGLKNGINDFLTTYKPLQNFKTTIKDLFGSDIGTKVSNLGTAFKGLFTSILDGDPISGLRNIKNAFLDLFSGFSKEAAFEKIKKLADSIRDFFKNLFKVNVGDEEANSFLPNLNTTTFTENLKRIGNSFKSSIRELFFGGDVFAAEGKGVAEGVIDGVADGIDKLDGESKKLNPLQWLISAITGGVSTIVAKASEIATGFGKTVVDGFSKFDFGKVKKLLLGGGIVFAMTKIAKFVAIIKGFGFKQLLGDISAALGAFANAQNSTMVLNFAKAIGIAAAALIALTFVDSQKLYGVVGAISALVLVIGLMMALVNKAGSGKIKNKVKQTTKNTLAIFEGFGNIFKDGAKYTGIGLMFTGIAAAIYIFARAMERLVAIDWKNAGEAVEALKIVLIGLAVGIPALLILGKIVGKDTALGLGLLVAGVAAVIWTLAQCMPAVASVAKSVDAIPLILGVLITVFLGLAVLNKTSNEDTSFVKIAVGLVLIGIALGKFKKALEGFKKTSLEDVAVGLITFAAVCAGLFVLTKNLDKDTSNGILKIAVAILVLTPALITLGNNAGSVAIGLIAMAGAMLVMVAAGWAVNKLGIAETLDSISKSILMFAAAMLVLAFAAPLMAQGILMVGRLFIENAAQMIVGLPVVIGLILAIGAAAKLVGVPIFLLGAGIVALGVGLGMILGSIGDFTDAFGEMGDVIGGVCDGLSGVLEGMGGVLSEFGLNMDSLFGNKAPEYSMAIDNYKGILGDLDFIDDNVATELAAKVQELDGYDGSDYYFHIKDIAAYIQNLDLDEDQKNRVITETITTAEQQQREKFTLTVHNIRVILDEHGIDKRTQDEIFDKLGEMAQLKKGEISYIVENVHYVVNNLPGLTDADKRTINNAVDDAINAHMEYNAAIRDIHAYISENTNITAEGAAAIEARIQEMCDREEFDTNLEKINAFVDDVGVKDPAKLRGKIRDALKQKVRMTTALGTINATIDNVDMEEDEKEDLRTKINDAITKASKIIEEGGSSEQVNGVLKDLNLKIDSIDSASLPESQKERLKALVKEAVNSIKSYDAEIKSLSVMIGELTPNQQTSFKELWDALLNSDKYNEAEVEKLWITCKDAGMTDEEIEQLLKKVGIALNKGVEKEIAISSLNLILDNKGVDGTAREQIEEQLKALDELEPDEDAEEYEIKRKAVVDLMVENGMTEEEANAIVDEYVGEAGDAKTAKLSLVQVLLNNATFGTEAEREEYKRRVEEMMQLSGGALATAIENFKKDILTKSTVTEAQKSLIVQSISDVASIATSAYSEAYAEVLEWEQKLRRQDLLGAFLVNTETGEQINGKSVVAKEMASFFKQFEGEVSDADIMSFAELLREKGYAPDEIIASFSGLLNETTGEAYTDEELFRLLFPLGEVGGLQPAMFRELIRPWVQNYVTGATEEFKDDVSRYGKLDWGEYLQKELDESGNWTGQYVDSKGTHYTTTRSFAEDVDEDLEGFEEDIKRYRKELDETLSDSDPITFEQIYDYFYGEENNMKYNEYSNSPLINFLQFIHQQIEENNLTLEEASALLNDTLYKTGDGITKASEKINEDLKKSYETLTNEQKTQIENLKTVFDPTNRYKNDWDFYGYLQSIFGSGFGTEGLEGINFDELLDGDTNITEEFLDWMTKAIHNEDISAEQLASLYHQFPTLRELMQEYYKRPEVDTDPEKQLPEGFQSELIDQIDEYKKQFDEALEKAASDDKKTSKEGAQAIHDMLSSGLVSEEEANLWISESPDIGEIFQDKFGSDIAGMDASGIVGNLVDIFSSDNFDASKIGDGIGGNVIAGLVNGLSGDSDAPAGIMDYVMGLVKKRGEDAVEEKSPSKWAERVGDYIDEGLAIGLYKGATKPVTAMKIVAGRIKDELQNKLREFTVKGVETVDSYASGINSRIGSAISAAASLARSTIDAVRNRISEIEEVGRNFGDGYVNGVRDRIEDAYRAGAELAKAAETGNKEASDSHSPSRVAMGLGNYFGMGYVIGMDQFGKKVHDSAAALASEAVNTLRNPLQIVQDVLNSDLDTDPTIRPVMDLSQIQNGVRAINGMLPETGYTLGTISSSMNRVKTTNEDVVAAIAGLSNQLANAPSGNTYNVNGITYDDGTNISEAVQSLVRAARVERRR